MPAQLKRHRRNLGTFVTSEVGELACITATSPRKKTIQVFFLRGRAALRQATAACVSDMAVMIK